MFICFNLKLKFSGSPLTIHVVAHAKHERIQRKFPYCEKNHFQDGNYSAKTGGRAAHGPWPVQTSLYVATRTQLSRTLETKITTQQFRNNVDRFRSFQSPIFKQIP